LPFVTCSRADAALNNPKIRLGFEFLNSLSGSGTETNVQNIDILCSTRSGNFAFLVGLCFTYLRPAKYPLLILVLLNKVYWDNCTIYVLGHIPLIRSGFYIMGQF